MNITHTISVKEQLNFCFRLLCKRGLEYKLEMGPYESFNSVTQLDQYFLFHGSVPIDFDGPCLSVQWVNYKGIIYKLNSYVAIDYDSYNIPQFGSIQLILCNESGDICLVCRMFSITSFDENMHAYTVETSPSLKCCKISELLSPFLLVFHTTANDKNYVALKIIF